LWRPVETVLDIMLGTRRRRPMVPKISRHGAVLLTGALFAMAGGATAQLEHFHPKGKPPSKHTIAVLEQARRTLPFRDARDFEEQKKLDGRGRHRGLP
jgi:hypothetical protein